MANPNFVANYSTNEIFRNEDTNRCLTDDLDTIESDIADLETNKADSDHTHSGYAAADHTHSGYAAAGHTHTEYAAAEHTHTGFASESHTHSGYAATSHTHSEYAGATHTHGQTDITGLSTALAGKAAASHTHSEYAASSHTHTPASIGAAAASHTHNYAASSHTHDYLPLTGGTVNGDVNVAGVIRGNGQQAYYFAQSTMSQTLGTNNATGGTNIACGADATCNIGGAIQKTASVLPRSTNTYLLGNANFRWKGIYSNAAVNVSSDERMKRDIAPMDIEELARFVNCLEVKTFNYKNDAEGADARIGLIAQEVQGVNPDIAKFFVKEGEDGMLGLTPADLVFASIAALQVANKRIEALEHKVATLEAHKCNCK